MFDNFEYMQEEGDLGSFVSYEPEKPEGLLPPRESSLCLGHEDVEKKLLDLINSGAMPHALIFSGQRGIGKATMAFRLARYLFKNGTSDEAQDSLFGDTPEAASSLSINTEDPIFPRVTSGGHPDLLTIERPMDAKKGIRKNSVDVETARKVAPFLRMTSSDGGWRVVIIDDADTMNRNAQNAMLKILEEPPSNAILILVTHRLGAMIPTIRSRCRVLNFSALPEDVMKQLIEKEVGNSLTEDQQNILNSMAGGSIGTAQKIIESNGLETTQNVLDIFQSYPKFNWVDIHHLADQSGRAGKNDAFEIIEKTFLWVVENFVFVKASDAKALPLTLNQEVYLNIMNARNLDVWLKVFENLKTHFIQANFSNLDKRQAVLGAFQLLVD
jgi:DNA polymerase-3 subunit delta'